MRSLGIGPVMQLGRAGNSVSALGPPDGVLIDDDTKVRSGPSW
jgi:hypothetical protein